MIPFKSLEAYGSWLPAGQKDGAGILRLGFAGYGGKHSKKIE